MASNNPISTPDMNDPSSSSTVFVQVDPSNFRLIVQKLTGAPPARPSSTITSSADATCHKRSPSFRLHERRRQSTMKKLELNFGHLNNRGKKFRGSPPPLPCFSAMVSPVSTLDQAFFGTGSPRMTEEEGEEAGVAAGKGLYLQTSSLYTPRGKKTPQLLHLFPLQSSQDPDY